MNNIKFSELIEKIQKGETEQFLLDNSIEIEYDLIDLYTKDTVNINCEVRFFNAEEIVNEIFINVDGIDYENICPLNMLEDLVNDFTPDNPDLNSTEIANKILSYLENDA
ncbi:hypothetical protein SAMN05880574_10313 [Chryseobacterium sp. RU37D]|nr:hypothetical protein SAMN05880574_10313 [Chryseobacterium sp. RU37D]